MKKSELRLIIQEEIRLLSENKEKTFDKFTSELKKKKIGALVKLYDYDREWIGVELGRDYPDRLANKVWDIAEKIGIKYDDVGVSAETVEPPTHIIKKLRINGGPKRW